MCSKITKSIITIIIFIISIIGITFADNIDLQPGQEITINSANDIILLKSGDYEIIAIDQVGNESTPHQLFGVEVKNKLYIENKDPNTNISISSYEWKTPENYAYNNTEGYYLVPQHGSITLNIPIPNNSNFKFIGWKIKSPTIPNGIITDGCEKETFTMGDQDTILTPIFAKSEYKIRLNYPQEGQMKSHTITVKHGINTDLPEVTVLPIETEKIGWMHKPIWGDFSNPPSYTTEESWEELTENDPQYADINNWHLVTQSSELDKYYNKFCKINSDGSLDGYIDVWYKTVNEIIIKPSDFDEPNDPSIEIGEDTPAKPSSDIGITGKYKQKYIGTERTDTNKKLYVRRYDEHPQELYVLSYYSNFYHVVINTNQDQETPRILGIYIDGRNDVVFKRKENIIISFSATDDRKGDISVYPKDITDKIYYKVKCEWYCEGEQSQIVPPLDYVEIGKEQELPKMTVLPIETPNCYWTYNDLQFTPQTTLSLDKYIKINGETITIKYYTNGQKLNAYIGTDLSNMTYNINCEYMQEGNIKTITFTNIKFNEDLPLPVLKVLPLTATIYGWYYNDIIPVKISTDLDKYVIKNNDIITIKFKLDDGASAYTEEEFNNITYDINCEYFSENEIKIIPYKDVKFNSNIPFPLLKVLPITANNYGWYYNNIEHIENSNSLDKYVVKNKDLITIKYKLDNGTNAYTEEDFNKITYTIQCDYNQNGEIKHYYIKDVKINNEILLPKVKILPITSQGLGWFKDEELVKSSIDIDKYVTANNVTIIVKYKTSNENDNVYILENDEKLLYNIKCNYNHQSSNKYFILENIEIGKKSLIPDLKVLPITYKFIGWYYNNNEEVIDSETLDKYITYNGQTIDIYCKSEPIPDEIPIIENQNKYTELLPEEFNKIYFYIDYGNGEEPIKYNLKDILDGKLTESQDKLKRNNAETKNGYKWDNIWRFSIEKSK